MLEVKNLYSKVENLSVLKGVSLKIRKGEAHVLMGPNGSGKSSLAMNVLGHPAYEITRGDILFSGKSIKKLKPNDRARLGIFLGFQQPVALEGVSFLSLIQSALQTQNRSPKTKNFIDVFKLRDKISDKFLNMGISDDFIMRPVNDGASGGERKKLELAQAQMLSPKLAIFDEIDTGLDVDALKKIGEEIDLMRKNKIAVILITHYQRILKYIKPDKVHIMMDGKIVQSGGAELAERISETGYSYLKCPI